MKECKSKIMNKICRVNIKKHLNKLARDLMKRCLWGEYVEFLYFNVCKLEKIQGTKRTFEDTYKGHIESLNITKQRKKRRIEKAKKKVSGSVIKEEVVSSPSNVLVKLEEKEVSRRRKSDVKFSQLFN